MSNRPYDASYEPRPLEQARGEQKRYRQFLNQVAAGGLSTRQGAERVAVSVLSALEDRLSAGEADDLRQELPWVLRDLVRDRERPGDVSPRRMDRAAFLGRVASELGVDELEAERTVRLVFAAARGLLSEKEASDVLGQLPRDLKDLWVPAA